MEGLHRGDKFIKRRVFRARWRKLMMALASVVVFCTTYALILPAITLEKGCDIPEHTHGEACYETQMVPQLQCSAAPHTHDGACYDAAGELICGQADFFLHVHDESCYGEGSQLLCTLPQIREHTHSEDCYALRTHAHGPECYTKVRGALICTLEESEGHAHDDICSGTVTELVCGQEEADGHTHGEDCCDEAGALLCELEEATAHGHTDECYATRQLECLLEESEGHTHSDDCWEWTEELTCDTPEEEWVLACDRQEVALHTHGDSCYDESGALVCGKLQVLSHTHGADCFQEMETQVLICTQAEHIHDETCQPASQPEYFCGKEAHTHTEECRDEEGTLVCQLEEHTHLESCMEAPQPEYFCGKEAHTHGESCYDETGILTCPLEAHTHDESCLEAPLSPYVCGKEEHIHGEGCYDEAGLLTCALEAHTHTDDCLPKTYYCGREEHVHDETCLNEAGERICGLAAHTHTDRCLLPIPYCGKEEHTHGEGCYDEVGTLTCPLEAHTHTPECYLPTLLTEEELAALLEELTQAVEELEALEGLTEEDITAAQTLMERLEEAYRQRWLTEEQFLELYGRVEALLTEAYDSLAEPCYGNNWIALRDSGWFYQYSGAGVATLDGYGLSTYAALEGDTSPSAQQIDSPGGTNSADDVTVSKTIAGTDLENVFDITLTVQTPQNIGEIIKEPDMAVVIVMDISNTMNEDFNGVSRYAAAVSAAEDFLDKFADNNSLGVSKVGYVAFNTDAHQIFELSPCTNETQANGLKNTMRTKTGNIINNYEKNEAGNVVDHSRFTNIEAGLKMAQDMLADATNKNKFIILLTDGFPTTYISSGYSGYDTYNPAGDHFYDHVLGRPCRYGTSYSDTAAIQAREMATSIKGSGTTIFSIGVDVGGQKIQDYIDDSNTDNAKKNDFSVVDRTSESYDIGGAEDPEAYKNWLRSSIGSGYYYDSTNTAGLKEAYNQIFEQIKTTVAQNTAADWVASDPIPSITPDEIDFIGLFDKSGTLQGDSLIGSFAEYAENTAEYKLVKESDQNKSIQWDLKKSGYTVSTSGGKTLYSYQLKYRVRLKNEDGAFVEGKIYDTNGTTTLQYRVIGTVNGNTVLSESATIEFPIPSVHGYLGELEFQKVDNYGRAVAGAEFTLHHAESCNICRGDKTQVTIADQKATSGEDGKVSFTRIPSGHVYTLEETKIPPGYSTGGYSYTVTVAYDKVTVTVTDSGGNAKDWNGTIVNNTSYTLPNTGGTGTLPYTLGGMALLAGAAALMYSQRKRRRGEGASS